MNNVTKMPLHEGTDYEILYPEFKFFIDKIENREHFSYVRFQLDAWSHLFKMVYLKLKNPTKPTDKELDVACKSVVEFWQRGVKSKTRMYHMQSGVVASTYKLLLSKKPDNFYLAVSDRTYWEGKLPPPKDPIRVWPVRLMRELLPEAPMYATCWRTWAQSGLIHKLFEDKERPIILVGPDYFANFGEKLGLKNFQFIQIHRNQAVFKVGKTIDQVTQARNRISKDKDVLILFCGGIAGCYVISALHGKLPNVFMLELGRNLNVYYHYDKIRKKTPKWMWGGWMDSHPPTWLQKPEFKSIIRSE